MAAKKNVRKLLSIIAMIFLGLQPASVHAQSGDGLRRRHRGYRASSLQLRVHAGDGPARDDRFQRVEETFADTV